MNILVTAPNFGFGPVSKLVSIVKAFLANTNYDITLFLSGNSLDYAKRNIESENITFLNNSLQSITPEIMFKLSEKYDVLLNVMDLDVQKSVSDLKLDFFTTKIFVDSLNWLWDVPIEGIEKNDAYFVQSYEHRDGNLPSNAIKIENIVDIVSLVRNTNYKDKILVNVAGLILPDNTSKIETNFVKKYVQFWIDTMHVLIQNNQQTFEVVFAINKDQMELNFELPDDDTVSLNIFSHEQFIEAASSYFKVFSTPGLTFRNECNMLGLSVFYLLPTNYSQALLVEDYLNEGDEGFALSLFGNGYTVSSGLEEMEGIRQVRSSVLNIIQQDLVNSTKIQKWIKESHHREAVPMLNGAESIVQYVQKVDGYYVRN